MTVMITKPNQTMKMSSNSKHETDENESGSESDQEENEEDKDDEDEESFSPQSLYEAASTLIEFELKKILIDKMEKSESYMAAPEHKECYEGLIKSYDLDKTFFSTYGKVYSLKRSRKDKDKDEDPSAGSDRGLKKRKTSKDAEPAKGPKAKESQSGSSKGDKSQSKSSGKSVQSEEPEFVRVQYSVCYKSRGDTLWVKDDVESKEDGCIYNVTGSPNLHNLKIYDPGGM
ncbi:hypothetical protein Tco_0366836 [Tanacetum coccineum]